MVVREAGEQQYDEKEKRMLGRLGERGCGTGGVKEKGKAADGDTGGGGGIREKEEKEVVVPEYYEEKEEVVWK